jgi:hypothetical protein
MVLANIIHQADKVLGQVNLQDGGQQLSVCCVSHHHSSLIQHYIASFCPTVLCLQLFDFVESSSYLRAVCHTNTVL